MCNYSQFNPEDMALAVGAKALHEGRQFMYEQARQYHHSFMEGMTKLFRPEFLEMRNCPVCNANDYRKLWVKEGGTYVKCNSCQMCYLNPVFTDSALKDFYNGNNTVQSEVVENESDFYRRLYERGLKAISEHVGTGHILDIGCSAGFFLDLARQQGWRTAGVDLNQREARVAIQKGHEVHNIPLETINFPQLFNAISMWDVFEHVKNGQAFLQSLRTKLTEDGVIFLQIPNFDSLATRILHEKCNMFDGLEHVNLYSPQTITRVAESNGFKIIHLETVISEIPIVANYLNYEDPYLGETSHDGKILDLIDERILHDKLLGYKMQIVLKPGT
jgi:2-polyprenyl-3-methyl-5-hydroxy-6-metoxy-1,4-benzoquinol methylase